jgi:polyisoprenoid-binding protein YceI
VTAPPIASDTTVAQSAETTAAPDATVATDTSPATDATVAPDTTQAGEVTGGESSGVVTYELTDESMVVFELDEVLNGADKRVIATNSEVAAQIAFDAADLSTAQLGTVVIGAQTFETDSGNRDRAIRGPVLDSNDFETIQFVPTSIDGLSGGVEIGDLIEFTVVGDLTIRDVSNEVTFTVSASLTDEDTLAGTGETTVSREAFGLEIPSVRSVAEVSDDVLLKIDFVADAID